MIDYNQFSYNNYYRKSKKGRNRRKYGTNNYSRSYNYDNGNVVVGTVTKVNKTNYTEFEKSETSDKKDVKTNFNERSKENTDDYDSIHNDKVNPNNIDARTKNRRDYRGGSELNYQSYSYKKRKKREIIAIMIIIMCFSFTIMLADIFGSGDIFGGLNAVFASSESVITYYAVEAGSYSTSVEARNSGLQYMHAGAGGYVIKDGTYRVILVVYDNIEDAEAVVEGLISDGVSATIYEIKGAKIRYNEYGDIGKPMETVINYLSTIYGTLYNISTLLDEGEISELEVRVRIAQVIEELSRVSDEFENMVLDHTEDETVIKVRMEIIADLAILENLLDTKIERVSLLSDIRYSLIMIVNCYCSLLKSL